MCQCVLFSILQKFGASVYKSNITWISENKFSICLLLFITVFMYFVSKTICKRSNKEILKLEKSSASKIGDLDEVVREIHYASCYCRMDPSIIPRCIWLLEMFPGACNVPLPIHNYTPFLRACWNGCYELILHMIQIGANVHATTCKGDGAIYLATYYIVQNKEKDYSVLKLLLEAGADINAARCDGYTALYLAAAKGHSGVVRWLLAQGARPTLPGRPSARRLASFYGHTKTAKLLYEENLNTP